MKKTEHGPVSPEPEKKKSLKEEVKLRLENFNARSDEPGEFLSGEQKKELVRKMSEGDEEARKAFEKNKDSKYRINSLLSVLGLSEVFLESEEAADILPEKKKELLERISKAREDTRALMKLPITKELVERVKEIVKEIEPYLNA